jgi:site-specific recombinase XerC
LQLFPVRFAPYAPFFQRTVCGLENQIRLKPTAKRTNKTVFFDDETAFILRRWLKVREGVNRRKSPALFLSSWGLRASRNDVYIAVTKRQSAWACIIPSL